MRHFEVALVIALAGALLIGCVPSTVYSILQTAVATPQQDQSSNNEEATPTPTTTQPRSLPSTTPKPRPTTAPATKAPFLGTVLVQGLAPFYLTFDRAKWEAVPLGDSSHYYLKHRTYAACQVSGMAPYGVPDEWVRGDDHRAVAGKNYAVLTFSSKSGSPLLFIYYTVADKTLGIQVSLFDAQNRWEANPQVSDNPTMCLQDAEEVIARSAARSFGAE